MEEADSFLIKLKNSTLFKVVAAYAAIAFVFVQVASLVSDTFGLSQQFMQNLIWLFGLGFPFLAVVAWAASSRFSTLKILGLFLAILITGYGSGSYIWVNNFILPKVDQAISTDDYVSAWTLVDRIDAYAPFFSKSNELSSDISSLTFLDVKDTGVKVSWKPYDQSIDEGWRYLGTSPLEEHRLPNGIIQIKLEKQGYDPYYLAANNPSMRFNNFPVEFGWKIDPIELPRENSVPEGMILIPEGNFIPAITGQGVQEYYLSSFYIDKFEVTNKEFKEFMDAGGYDNYQYWVDMEFVKDGVSLSWEESKELMVDSTNIIGPALWEVGTYLDGQEDYPVTGISWYEALAYARYKGNILPPMFHWAKAAYPPEEIVAPVSPKLLTNSNFSGKELIKVGQQGLGPYGTYDMTGNAREWVWNIFGGRGLTLGGAYSDPAYIASQTNPMPRFDRSPINGVRTVRLLNPRDMNPFGNDIVSAPPPPPDYYKELSEEAYKIYAKNFEVGPRNLNPELIYREDSHPIWIKERILIDVGYNSEKMDIVIFRPKDKRSESGAVIVYPGANYCRTPPEIDDIDPGEYGLDFIIKSGRALVWPALKESMNRITDMNITFPPNEDYMRQFRELLVNWTVDTHRTIDYLETRDEIDPNNIFYLGMSYGSIATTHVMLFEPRFNASLLYVGGAGFWAPPLSDGINLFPRMTTPTLMLNGEQDYIVPVLMAQSMYNFLGTPEEDKRLIFYPSGHWPLPRNQMINESLIWLDKYTQ